MKTINRLEGKNKIEEGKTIPKNVYMKTSWELPLELESNLKYLQELNPEYTFHVYNDEQASSFILNEFGKKIYDLYESINIGYGAAKADFFRYLLLYAQGGVYIDIKSSMTLPLNEILPRDNKFPIIQWDNEKGEPHEIWGLHKELAKIQGGEYIQWFIAAPKGSPFLLEVINRVIDNLNHYNPFVHSYGRVGTLRVTGPIAYTLAINSVLERYPHIIVKPYRKFGLIYSIYEEKKTLNKHHHDLFKHHYSQQKNPIIGNRNNFYNYIWDLTKIWKLIDYRDRINKKLRGNIS